MKLLGGLAASIFRSRSSGRNATLHDARRGSLQTIQVIIIIEVYLTRVKHVDYWSPSSFHNGLPTTLKL